MSEKNIKIPWPGWHIIGELGEGGYGRVYEIERQQLGITERAALKVISIPKSKTEYDSIRFLKDTEEETEDYFEKKRDKVLREIDTLKSLKGCANVLDIDDWAIVDKEDGPGWDIYIRMELLQNLLTAFRGGAATEADVIEIGKDICTALERCETRNIVHRDIKPQNILVSGGKDFKLTDFGIARTLDHTTNMTGVGTPPYMSPEVANGDDADKTVDMYSLGLVMYELLNNRRLPFVPKNFSPLDMRNAIDRRLNGEKIPEPANGSPELKKVILKACAFDPKDRYRSASEMKSAIIRAEKGIKEDIDNAEWAAGSDYNITVEPEPEKQPEKHQNGRSTSNGKAAMANRGGDVGWNDASVTVAAEDSWRGKNDKNIDLTKTSAADDLGINNPSKKAPATSKSSDKASTPGTVINKEKKSSMKAICEGIVILVCIVVPYLTLGGVFFPNLMVKLTANVNDGGSFNSCIKDLAGDDDSSILGEASVKAICRSETEPSFFSRIRIFKDENPDEPVYMWYEDGTVYYYCEADKIVLPADSSYMFDGCSSLTELDLSSFDTGSVTDMDCMFDRCSSLTELDLSSFDTSSVTRMYGMFFKCELLRADCSDWDVRCVEHHESFNHRAPGVIEPKWVN